MLLLWLIAAIALWVCAEGLIVYREFQGRLWTVPARVYASPLELYAGKPVSRDQLIERLRQLGYRRAGGDEVASAAYWPSGQTLRLRTRGFGFWDGDEPVRTVQLDFDARGIHRIRDGGGVEIPVMRLDPMEIGSIFPLHGEDRLVIQPEAIPDTLRTALVAVEDRKFFSHHGLDPQAIARAAWANLRAGRVRQGGSTLTQQLVKSYFLDNRRSFRRKIREAVMALWVESIYDKDEILTAYVNEIYLGQDGRRAVHGFGLASRFYFGRPLAELKLHEQALLVAVVRGPTFYNPWKHPQRALQRRDLVLRLIAEQDVVDAAEANQAMTRPLDVLAEPGGSGYYPAYLDVVRRQLELDYPPEELSGTGLRVFTALDLRIQEQAESSLEQGIARLEKQDDSRAGLEGAVVVSHPQTGELQAVAGGRRRGFDGFNRALLAARPVGSLIKPAVYLAAIEQGRNLADLVLDEPIEITLDNGDLYRPRNFSGDGEGEVTLVKALAQSLNMATVRLGMESGLSSVIDVLHRLGVEADLAPYPSLLLGAAEMTPIQVAGMYTTLASGGFRTPLRAVRAVLDAEGAPLNRYPISLSAQFSAQDVFQLNSGLVQVMKRGSGRSASGRLPGGLVVAGKTGTSDEFRDSWFAGFSGDNLAVVWLGNDDNTPTGLSGARGALLIWSDLIAGLAGQSFAPLPPPGIAEVWIDYADGKLSREGCEDAILLALPEDAQLAVNPNCGPQRRSLKERVGEWLQKLTK
ncbi:MAG: penicillin-binding protein 1B [Gammaproteobacteria bacterium]